MPSILLSNHYSAGPMEIVLNILPNGFSLITLNSVDQQELLNKVKDADYILASGRLLIDKEVIDNAVKLKMIQRTGVGLDNLDLKYIKKREIPVYVNQGINSQSVAEHTILLILAVLRRLPVVDARVKNGIWAKQEEGIRNSGLKHKTIGLVGMGNIGCSVAKILKGFNAQVLYHDRTPLSLKAETELNVQYCTFDELLKRSDVLSLHCALNSETLGLIGEKQLSIMKQGAIIVNTARGRLIDESALIACLESGHIKAVGLDVFETEPIDSNNPLLAFDNVVLTPHIGGITFDSFYEMISDAMNNIYLFEIGKLEEIEEKRLIISDDY